MWVLLPFKKRTAKIFGKVGRFYWNDGRPRKFCVGTEQRFLSGRTAEMGRRTFARVPPILKGISGISAEKTDWITDDIFIKRRINYERYFAAVEKLDKAIRRFQVRPYFVFGSSGKEQSWGLLAKNGAGKSTTINAILDLIHKDDGTVTFWAGITVITNNSKRT